MSEGESPLRVCQGWDPGGWLQVQGKGGEPWEVCQRSKWGGGSDGLLKFQREKGWEFWGFVNGLRGGEGGPQELFHSSRGCLSLRATPITPNPPHAQDGLSTRTEAFSRI